MEKPLMVDYTTSVVVEWFVPRVETRAPLHLADTSSPRPCLGVKIA
jgi:hypothetical protein